MKKIALSFAVIFTLAMTNSTAAYSNGGGEGKGKKKEKAVKCCKKGDKKSKSCYDSKSEKGAACVKKADADKKKEASK